MLNQPKSRRGFRIEEDALGDVGAPADRLWRAQTQRSFKSQFAQSTA
jgi:fumarate hydratase class II